MKSTQSIEEETLLPTSLLEDEIQDPEIIANKEFFPNCQLKGKTSYFEYDMFKSNFSNSKVSTFDFKEEISEETNDLSKEKDEQSLKNYYCIHLNNSNDSFKPNQNVSDEDSEKKWSLMNPALLPELKNLEPNQNDYFLNVNEHKRLNIGKKFQNVFSNGRIDNRFNGTLNIFTNDLSNINNIN